MIGRLWSFRTILVLSYPVTILLTTVAVLAAAYAVAQGALKSAAHDSMHAASDAVVAKLGSFLDPAERAVEAAITLLASGEVAWDDHDALERHFLTQLHALDGIDGLYFATSDGDFVYVSHGQTSGVPYLSKFMVDGGNGRVAIIRSRDLGFGVATERRDETDSFDPRSRPWYRVATRESFQGWTEPYIYYTSLQPGVSFAKSVPCQRTGQLCVVGIDISLAAMSDFLTRLPVGTNGGAFLMTEDARLIAARGAGNFFRGTQPLGEEPALPSVAEFPDPLVGAVARALAPTGEARRPAQDVATFRYDGQTYLASLSPAGDAQLRWIVAAYVPQRDFFGWFEDLQQRAALAALAAAIAATLLAVAFSRRLSDSLRRIYDNLRQARGSGNAGLARPASRLTELRAIEEALIETVGERQRTEAAIQMALDLSVHANQAKTDFLAHMSHELRTPLNAIVGFADLLRLRAGSRLDGREQGYLHDIDRSARLLTDIIASVLEAAAATDGKLQLDEQTVRIEDTIRTARNLVGRVPDDKHLTVTVDIAPDLAIEADPAKLQQIVLSLLTNAVRHAPAGGHVDIQARAADDAVVISVRDDGPGMTADETRRALEPFSRLTANPYVASGSGIGLGLTLARLLTELHGGTIDLVSAAGAGTVATLRLPLARLRPVRLRTRQ